MRTLNRLLSLSFVSTFGLGSVSFSLKLKIEKNLLANEYCVLVDFLHFSTLKRYKQSVSKGLVYHI